MSLLEDFWILIRLFICVKNEAITRIVFFNTTSFHRPLTHFNRQDTKDKRGFYCNNFMWVRILLTMTLRSVYLCFHFQQPLNQIFTEELRQLGNVLDSQTVMYMKIIILKNNTSFYAACWFVCLFCRGIHLHVTFSCRSLYLFVRTFFLKCEGYCFWTDAVFSSFCVYIV